MGLWIPKAYREVWRRTPTPWFSQIGSVGYPPTHRLRPSDSPNRSSHGRLDCVLFFLLFSSISSSTPPVHWRGLVDVLGLVITVVLVE